MTPAIDPLIDYNGEAPRENSNYLNGTYDSVTALGKNREMSEAKGHADGLDAWAGNDVNMPGTFLIGGALPCERMDTRSNQKSWLFTRGDAMAWAVHRYGMGLVQWEKNEPRVLEPGVLWSTLATDADPGFWQIRVCTPGSLELNGSTSGQG